MCVLKSKLREKNVYEKILGENKKNAKKIKIQLHFKQKWKVDQQQQQHYQRK